MRCHPECTHPERPHLNAFCSECLEPRRVGLGNNGASERMVKCAHCHEQTLHVVVGTRRNRNEASDLGAPRQVLEDLAPRRADDLIAAGVRPIYVDQLGMDALLLEARHIVLIDMGLSAEQIEQIAKQVRERMT